MTFRGKKTYDPAIRADSVRLVLTSGWPVKQVAEEIEVKESTLGNWLRAYRAKHPASANPARFRGPVCWEEHQWTGAENKGGVGREERRNLPGNVSVELARC